MAPHSVLDVSRPGTYALVLRCQARGRVRIGRLGVLVLEPGWYVYIGSAFGPGGLAARVGRHLRGRKPRRWHIDSLRARLPVREVWWTDAVERREHLWARELIGRSEGSTPLEGFGASDCGCPTHLVRFPWRPEPPGAAARTTLIP